jgi:CHASE2 domain-containing sensor protein
MVKAVVKQRIAKEWAKGTLACSGAIAGGFLMSWSSKLSGFAYWFGTISGLVIFCVGFAYVVEFIKLLIIGDLPKATVVLIRGLE